MPSTLEGALVFTLVIAPGYLLVRGFSVGRTYTPPAKDLYVLAEAVVASLFWLALVYLVRADQLETWGVLPRNEEVLRDHGSSVAWLVLIGLAVLPYLVGRLGGWASRKAGDFLGKYIAKTEPTSWWIRRKTAAFFENSSLLTPPTLWDKAWTQALHPAGRPVTVHLKDGPMVYGVFTGDSDLSPRPHQVLLEDAQAFDDQGNPLPFGVGPAGVYLEGTEIKAVYFDNV